MRVVDMIFFLPMGGWVRLETILVVVPSGDGRVRTSVRPTLILL